LDSLEIAVANVFNRHYAYIEKGSVVVYRNYDGWNRVTPFEHAPPQFITNLQNVYIRWREVEVKKKKDVISDKELARIWLKSPHRRTYHSKGFSPYPPGHQMAQDAEKVLNTYEGPRWSDIELLRAYWTIAGSIINQAVVKKAKFFMEHVYNIICKGNKATFVLLCKILGLKFRKPWVKITRAIMLRGHCGNGKSYFIESVMKPFGRHTCTCHNSAITLGNFNGELQDSLAVFFDEIHFPGDQQSNKVFKNLVSQTTMILHKKYREPITVPNCLLVCVSSNDSWVYRADASERRIFGLETADFRKEVVGAAEYNNYFQQLSKVEEDNHAGLRAWIYFLSNFFTEDDLDSVEKKIDLPSSCNQFLREQKNYASNPVTLFWQVILDRKFSVPPVDDIGRPDRIENKLTLKTIIDHGDSGRVLNRDYEINNGTYHFLGTNGAWLNAVCKDQIFDQYTILRNSGHLGKASQYSSVSTFWTETKRLFPSLQNNGSEFRIRATPKMLSPASVGTGDALSIAATTTKRVVFINRGHYENMKQQFAINSGLVPTVDESQIIEDEEERATPVAFKLLEMDLDGRNIAEDDSSDN